MKKIFTAFVLLFSLGFSELANGQDAQFTQFYANPLYLNPAFAGTARCPRIVMNYRNQWPNLQKMYITYNASYDQHIDAISGGLGFLVTHDQAGDGTLSTTDLNAMYSYQLNLTRQFSVHLAAEGGYHQKGVDWNKLTFGDMIDAKRGFVYQSAETYTSIKHGGFDFSGGILGYSKHYFVGFAVNHITQPDEGFILSGKLPMKMTGHAGAIIPLDRSRNSESYISPNILYQQQGDFRQLNLGLYLAKGPIVGGLWYRNRDSFIALIGFQQNQFKFGYSYDVTISKLANATAGAHEISCQIVFECKPKKKRYRTVSCPSF